MIVVRPLYAIVLFGFLVSTIWGRVLRDERVAKGDECLDLAIIGGGVGGTYSAWKLKDKDMSIEIFEQSDRIGGRLFSVFLPSMPNVAVELGGMRYIPGVHTTVESLIDELNLEVGPFKPAAEDIMYYFRRIHLTREELATSKLPYNLKPDEPKDPDELRWSFYQRALNTTNPDQIKEHTLKKTADGIPIYKQGYLTVMGNIWSNEAKEYLRSHLGFWSDFEENVNAAQGLWGYNPAEGGHDGSNRLTLAAGLNAIPDTLVEQFVNASLNNKVNLNQRVDAIKKVKIGNTEFYNIDIYDSETVDGYTTDTSAQPKKICAHQVIIAGPRRAQEMINWSPLQNDPLITEALNSVYEFHATKIFMVYPEAWWDKLDINYKSLVTDIPLQKTMEFGRYTTPDGQERAMLLHYADGNSNVDYWNELRAFEGTISSDAVPAAFAVSKKLAEHVHHHMSDLFGIDVEDIPAPIDGIMSLWRDDPYGAAWHYFRPGYDWDEVQRTMRRPSTTDNVFVISNSYAADELASWIEGSLLAANDVLEEFFLS